VIEVDGVSVDGWIEEVKIEQSMSRVDDIVTRLRVRGVSVARRALLDLTPPWPRLE
jgi:hypothetical protein